MGNKWVGTVGSIKAAGRTEGNVKQSSQQGETAGFNPATLTLRPEYVPVA